VQPNGPQLPELCHTVGTYTALADFCHTVGTYTALQCHTVGTLYLLVFTERRMITPARRAELILIFRRVVRTLIHQVQLRWNWHRLGVALRPQAELFVHLARAGNRLDYSSKTKAAARAAAAAVPEDTDTAADQTTDL
jgi:hypothetical protein